MPREPSMSPVRKEKFSGHGGPSAAARMAGLVLMVTSCFLPSCFDDRSLGTIAGDGDGGTPGAPSGTCAVRATYDACEAAGCRWLEPGCGAPPLPRATCSAVSEINCSADSQCPAGKKCTAYNINPCSGPTAPGQVTCGACGQSILICW